MSQVSQSDLKKKIFFIANTKLIRIVFTLGTSDPKFGLFYYIGHYTDLSLLLENIDRCDFPPVDEKTLMEYTFANSREDTSLDFILDNSTYAASRPC